MLLRHIGIADQGDGSFAGGQLAVERVLEANGIDLRGSVLYDGSGLSRENLMSPQLLVDVIRWAASDDQPDLRAVVMPAFPSPASPGRSPTGSTRGRRRVPAGCAPRPAP